jgi:hypothetical protein
LGLVRPDVDKPDHVEQVRPAETCSVIGCQLSRQRRDNLFAVPGALLAEDVPANPVSDAPVKKYELSVDGLGSAMACSVDEGSNIGDEDTGDLRRNDPNSSPLARPHYLISPLTPRSQISRPAVHSHNPRTPPYSFQVPLRERFSLRLRVSASKHWLRSAQPLHRLLR